ncbi:tyrosine-type recombinase/integrase [Cohaesibacter celericrescens]|uniref:tyrosine-type recombinase/integrase n=1 Tax=Cohaesibacter celericrescens TaxID=2067669 RepID=UPI003562C8D2
MKTKQLLTDKLIQSLATNESRLHITDTKTVGLKIRVAKSGLKSFALMARDAKGMNRTITLGRYPEISLKKARELADYARIEIKHGQVNQAYVSVAPKHERTTLRDLLDEVEPIFAVKLKGWRLRGKPGSRPEMRSTIECVFGSLLDKQVESISEEQLSGIVSSYRPVRPLVGKDTANGQVSRAMTYLSRVLDWAAHRGKDFIKLGAGRPVSLNVPDMKKISDPSSSDPTITGRRDRVLDVYEIRAIYPLLSYPPHLTLRRQNIPLEKDFGPIAMMFLLLTVSRREEVANARWSHINFENGVWFKPEVKEKNVGVRSQHLPLSTAAVNLLRSLPGSSKGDPFAYVFPNSVGGKLGNWNRISEKIQTVSNTRNWTRHDLRRTGATMLKELQVPLHIVEEILAHTNPFAKSDVSGSAVHYMDAVRILVDLDDPIVVALNNLHKALEYIVDKE